MKYSLKNILFFGLIAVLVAAVPVFVMELVGANPPQALRPISGGTPKEQTWITFFGAYIGSIIGAIGAVTIMFLTLRHGRHERLESRRYADFLFIRDILDQTMVSVDESPVQEALERMFRLLEADFRAPDIKTLQNGLRKERTLFHRLERALSQTIVPNQEKVSDNLKKCFLNLFSWEGAFCEFIDKILSARGSNKDISQWASKRASILGHVFETISKDIQEADFVKDENLEPVKYSFARFFVIPEGDSDTLISLGGRQSENELPLAFLNAMQRYQDTHEKILRALNDASGALVSSLKKETVS